MKVNCKKGFFMPTVTIYIIFFFSFITFQIVQVVDYQLILKEQEKALQMYAIKQNIVEKMKKDKLTPTPKVCIIPSTYKNYMVGEYKVSYKRSCARKASIASTIAPGNSAIKGSYKLLKSGKSHLTTAEYTLKEAEVIALMTLQINNEWVGIPIDFDVITPVSWPKYIAILSLEFLQIYDIKISSAEQTEEIMVIYNEFTKKLEAVFYT